MNIAPPPVKPAPRELPETWHRSDGTRHEMNYDNPTGLLELMAQLAEPYRAKDPKTVAPRRWLYGDSYQRETLTIIGARGGTGKTSLENLLVYDMVTGALNIQHLHKGTLRVCFVSLEDSQEELERRFEAIRKHYRGMPDVWGDRLTLISLARYNFFKVTKNESGSVVTNEEAIEAIKLLVNETKCDVLIFDPLVRLHHLPESDNTKIAEVASRIIEIAIECEIAVGLVHHVRKTAQGQSGPVTADDLRGGGSLGDAARIVRMVSKMTEADAKRLDVPEHERWRYIRRDYAKDNYSPEGTGVWFKKIGVDLGNAIDGYLGDQICVVERAVFTSTADDISPEAIAAIRSAIGGGDHREHPAAKDWAGIAIGKVLGLNPDEPMDKAKINRTIKRLLAAHVLAVETRKDRQSRERPFIIPGPVCAISAADSEADDAESPGTEDEVETDEFFGI